MASRTPPTPVEPAGLMVGSKCVMGFWLVDCLSRPQLLSEPMAELMAMTSGGTLRPIVGNSYPLADARRAHEDMRARRTTGKVILDPTSGTA
jgi:NADPH2:quinone reductase